jgi:multidrug efflux system membrane fusion protein
LALAAVAAYYVWPRVSGAAGGAASTAPAANQGGAGRGGRGSAATPVVAVKVTRGSIGEYITGLGNVTPIYTVTVKSRVDGQLMEIHYKEGDVVQKGAPLLEIDPRPYEVQLEQAQGALLRDQALLDNAKVDLNRYAGLLKQNAVPEQQYATQQALVAQDEGVVKADQGQIDSAKLNLVYCHITAPITGRVGLRLVDPGNIVHATDTTGLLVIAQIQPISVIFPVAEDQLPLILPRFRAGQQLQVDAWDRDQTHKLGSGTLATLDNQIDQTTGTVRLRADFPNTDDALFPNQFVYARLLVQEKRGVTLLPTAAIQRTTTNTYVWLVKPDSTVTERDITVGTSEGDQSQILSGLEPGDEAVMTGVDKLNEGAKVNVQVQGPGSGSQPATAANAAGKTGKQGGTAQ